MATNTEQSMEQLRAEIASLKSDLSNIAETIRRMSGEAAEQGITAGAMILEVHGEAAGSPMQVLELVRQTPAGSRATLRFWQDGETREVDLSTEVPEPRTPSVTPGSGDGLRV